MIYVKFYSISYVSKPITFVVKYQKTRWWPHLKIHPEFVCEVTKKYKNDMKI